MTTPSGPDSKPTQITPPPPAAFAPTDLETMFSVMERACHKMQDPPEELGAAVLAFLAIHTPTKEKAHQWVDAMWDLTRPLAEHPSEAKHALELVCKGIRAGQK